MSKIKVLSGEDVVKIFASFSFIKQSQKGSHVKLKRILADGTEQKLTIPLHDELDKGTLKAIFRQATRYVPETVLKPHFYSD